MTDRPTNEEVDFLISNRKRIFDLIRAVDKHEEIRLTIGPGQIHNHPELLPDYERCHDIMSRLSQFLYGSSGLGVVNVGPLDDHSDIEERTNFTKTIIGSC